MQLWNVTWKWNIPNALSVLRILLIPVFMVLYLNHQDGWALAVLLFSGLTDMLDGIIARRFNQITDCGKLLDPVSDKLTQVAVIIALTTRFQELLPLAVLCLVKETCQAVGSVILLRNKSAVRGSKWFGKVSTVVFYACMSALVLFDEQLPSPLRWACIGLAGVSMLVAFVGYLRIFLQASRVKASDSESAEAEKG